MGSRPSSRPRRRRAGHRRRFLRRTAYAVLVVAMAAGTGAVWAISQVDLPTEVVLAQTSVVLARDGTPIAELRSEQDRFPVELDQVSPHLINGVIAAEDQDFRTHPGIDALGIARALWAAVRDEGVLQGGSTITQQYVKNVYLTPERSVERKVKEAALAIRLEQELSKDEILERYLNTVYFGRGAYGVEAAARAYFGASAAELDLVRSALLAGLIRAPETGDPAVPAELAEAERRTGVVLDAMAELGMIGEAEREAARAFDLASLVRPRTAGSSVRITSAAADAGVEWFVDAVRRQLIERYGASVVFAGGLEVTTTLDLEVQRAATRTVAESITGGPSAALVTLDAEGGVMAMVGGLDWDRSQVNLALGRQGGGSGRQAGSAFKPLVLATAVSQGISTASRFVAPAELVVPEADQGADWVVRDPAPAPEGVLDLREATVRSSNTVYAELIMNLGADRVVETATRLGIGADLVALPSVALGAQEVSALDLATAYSVFANEGVRRDPVMIRQVVGADVGIDDRVSAPSERVMTPGETAIVSDTLRAVVTRGTGAAARVEGVPMAGKTGTTQNNADAWFVGYTPMSTTAVWVGYAEGARPLVGVLGQDRVTGGNVPARLMSTYVSRVPALLGGPGFPAAVGDPGVVLNPDLVATTTSTTLLAALPGVDDPPDLAPETSEAEPPETSSPATSVSETPETASDTAPSTSAAPVTAAPETTAPPDTATSTTTVPETAPASSEPSSDETEAESAP